MTVNLKDVKQIFREKQYKLTTQRQLILQTFFDHPGQHLSAEDVFDIVRRESAEIGLATVYRTLELLSDLEFLQKIDFGDGRNRYEINSASEAHHHHHLICLACGKVRECDDDLLEALESSIARKTTLRLSTTMLNFLATARSVRKSVKGRQYVLRGADSYQELAVAQVTALFSMPKTEWAGSDIRDLPDDTLLIYHQLSCESSITICLCEIFYQTNAGLRYTARRDSHTQPQADPRWLLKLNLYHLLCEMSNMAPSPWGILSGVRPSKIVHRLLDKGISSAAITQLLTQQYALQMEKATLVTGIALRQRPFLLNADKKKVSIYIGIPFCPTRCLYCSFPAYVLPGRREIQAFLTALFADMSAAKLCIDRHGLSIESVYIGGGTPTSLPCSELDELLSRTASLFVGPSTEFTVEAGRPDSLDDDKIRLLAKYKVGRVSVNPQTMQEKTLKLIGRMHSVQDIICVFGKMRMCNIPVVNMDLIAGLPGETCEDMEDTLRQVASLRPDNLTVHTLALKRGSRLSETLDAYPAADGLTTGKMLAMASQTAANAGMQAYYLYRQKRMAGNLENIGYSLPGKECIYNIQVIEERQTIIGIGPAATTKVVASNGLTNVFQPKDVSTYIAGLQDRLTKRNALMAAALGE